MTDHELRWFVLPPRATRAFENSPDVEWAPAYLDREGVRKWGRVEYEFDAERFPSLPFAGETMYIAGVVGTPDALDAIAAEADAFGKQEYGFSDSEVAGYMNERLDRDRTFAEWIESFGLSDN